MRRLDIAYNFSVDSQTAAPYIFAVHGGDISQYDLTQVVQGPPGSTVAYHGGNCFYLYMSPSTLGVPQEVTLNDAWWLIVHHELLLLHGDWRPTGRGKSAGSR